MPIVALTANVLESEKKKCFDAGMNGQGTGVVGLERCDAP